MSKEMDDNNASAQFVITVLVVCITRVVAPVLLSYGCC